MSATYKQSVLYFEDMHEGMHTVSPARTISEADVVAFAGLSGDYNALHMNEEAARSSVFGRRIAHGLLGVSVASGLFTRTWLSQALEGALVAWLGFEWKFVSPIYMGDTILVEATVTGKRETSNPERGIVSLERTVRNQHGEIVQSGATQLLVLRRARQE